MHRRNPGGRPVGSRTKAPVVDIRTARRALREVKARALEGDPADQRAILAFFAAQPSPLAIGVDPALRPFITSMGGPGLLCPEFWQRPSQDEAG